MVERFQNWFSDFVFHQFHQITYIIKLQVILFVIKLDGFSLDYRHQGRRERGKAPFPGAKFFST